MNFNRKKRYHLHEKYLISPVRLENPGINKRVERSYLNCTMYTTLNVQHFECSNEFKRLLYFRNPEPK
jgi:hypothetical protein